MKKYIAALGIILMLAGSALAKEKGAKAFGRLEMFLCD